MLDPFNTRVRASVKARAHRAARAQTPMPTSHQFKTLCMCHQFKCLFQGHYGQTQQDEEVHQGSVFLAHLVQEAQLRGFQKWDVSLVCALHLIGKNKVK